MSNFRAASVSGAFAIVSGFITPHLSDAFHAVLPDWSLVGVPFSLWLAGLAFGVALAAAFAFLLAFHPRQLLIIPFVLAGWFCAVQVGLWMGVDEPKSYARLTTEANDPSPCIQLDGTEHAKAADEQECFQIYTASAQGSPAARFWRAIAAYATAGALGALITAFGAPFATRRSLSGPSYLAITFAGALVAVAWFVIAGAIAALQADQHWYALFVPWQTTVAVLIGYSILNPSSSRSKLSNQ
jgi:hypothetical protein